MVDDEQMAKRMVANVKADMKRSGKSYDEVVAGYADINPIVGKAYQEAADTVRDLGAGDPRG